MGSIAFSIPVPELLYGRNYAKWAILVRTYLEGQDLWEDIINDNENATAATSQKENDDEDAIKIRRRRNSMALHVIQTSCGTVAFSEISTIRSADTAWQTLKKKYLPADTDKIDKSYLQYADLHKAVLGGNLKAAKEFLDSQPEAVSMEITDKGETALHIAVTAGHAHIVKELVSRMSKEDLGIEDSDGCTALMKASEYGRSELEYYLYNHTPQKDLAVPAEQDKKGAKIRAIYSKNLDTGEIDKSYLQYADLYKAVLGGNLKAAKEFLDSQPEAVRKAITDKGETALHIAVTAGHAHIVKELVDQHRQNYLFGDSCRARMTTEDLGIEDDDGCTALMKALEYGRSELARYLYTRTPSKDLMPAEKDEKGAMLLTRAIYSKNLDLALDVMWRCRYLTYTCDDRGVSPFLALASMPHIFPSGTRLGFWKQLIYDYCIRVDLSPPETRLDINNESHLFTTQPVSAVVVWSCVSSTVSNLCDRVSSIVSNLLGISQLYEMKKMHIQSEVLLSLMCDLLPTISRARQLTSGGVYDAINRAVKNGIFEFVSETMSKDPTVLEMEDIHSRNLFMLAVRYRHYNIFSLIKRHGMNSTWAFHKDDNDENMLHMTGIIGKDSIKLHRNSGATLQMQRELQWFKAVESISNPEIKEGINKDGLTPRQLFSKNHENMLEKGEKWMKDTSSSCTVVGALIVTIMFAVAFTVPGGNDQTIGFPIFLKKKLFMLFIVSDALSLFSSSTSVLIFLGILTSSYEEEDFLESLPRKMIIGLSTLFFSIATMMIAFSAALLLMLRDQSWIVIPIICLASVPVTLFILMQFPLLVGMIKSTYFPGKFMY